MIDSPQANNSKKAETSLDAQSDQLNPEGRANLRIAAQQAVDLPPERQLELEALAQTEVQIEELVNQARAAALNEDWETSINAQEQAVLLCRTIGESHEGLLQLSLLLYDLAGYYQRGLRHDEAVFALEEVVLLDHRTNHPDLKSDQETLEQARQMRAMAAGEPQVIAAIEAQMSAAEPEVRDLLEEASKQFTNLSQEERAKMDVFTDAAVTHHRIQQLADQTRDVAIAALRRQADAAILAEQMEFAASQASEGEMPGSPWNDVAAFIQAVAHLLRNQPVPPVPSIYASHLADIQDAAN